MGTRSTIAVQHADGTISQIYCHWDGYLSYNGKILQEHYNSLERAEALVAIGDLSSLAPSCDCPEGHSFDTPAEGYCVAYGRDRGEDGTAPNVFETLSDYRSNFQDEEYNYLFRNGEWEVISYATDNEWVSLSDALEREAEAEAE